MLRKLLIITMLCALLLTVPASARVTDPAAPELLDAEPAFGRCTNHGIVTQVAILGENRYCEDQQCENYGIIVFVGETRSCYGNGASGACLGDVCGFLQVSRPADSQHAAPLSPVAGEGAGPCGVVTEPVCWTTSFGCRWIWGAWHGTVGPLVGDPPCECHDGDPNCEPHQGPGRPPLVILVVERGAHA